LVVVAVEVEGIKKGRIRLAKIPDVSNKILIGFIENNVENISTIITDGLPSYNKLASLGCIQKT